MHSSFLVVPELACVCLGTGGRSFLEGEEDGCKEHAGSGGNTQVARTVLVHAADGGMVMEISVTSVELLTAPPAKSAFAGKGSEWKRQFTDEMR
jgi:hypothetical protein